MYIYASLWGEFYNFPGKYLAKSHDDNNIRTKRPDVFDEFAVPNPLRLQNCEAMALGTCFYRGRDHVASPPSGSVGLSYHRGKGIVISH